MLLLLNIILFAINLISSQGYGCISGSVVDFMLVFYATTSLEWLHTNARPQASREIPAELRRHLPRRQSIKYSINVNMLRPANPLDPPSKPPITPELPLPPLPFLPSVKHRHVANMPGTFFALGSGVQISAWDFIGQGLGE